MILQQSQLLLQLAQLEQALAAHREAKTLQPEFTRLRAVMKDIETATASVELRSDSRTIDIRGFACFGS